MDTVLEKIGYINGVYMPLREIAIPPYDLGFLRGYAVFDVMPVEHGKPFLWEDHYERLCRSAEALHLTLPVDRESYNAILDTLIEKNPSALKQSLRTVLSGGPSQDAFTPEKGRETFLVCIEETHIYLPNIYTDGVKIITLSFERILPQVKLANHVMAIRDLARREKNNAFEELYVTNGFISEATQSNIFMVKGNVLVTTWDNVLRGITQKLTLHIAEQCGIVVEKRNITLQELLSADEVFITSSSKHIVPVVRVDEMTIGDGRPGEMTQRLITAFEEFVERY
ncbi:MAG: aminotransferase class IV [Candidatus Moranbacteria bacterium]|nr:aminotransferase class IV [Candidatus Moranbacteria bacterium]MDD3965220.1 aminotransferase class IV [Candidatus Moranbacteria bacterium]